MNIGNITNTLFPADWDPTDFTSPGTQILASTITVVALAAITLFVRNRNNPPPPTPVVTAPVVAAISHKIEVAKKEYSLTITIFGDRKSIPQKIIDEANGAIKAWHEKWQQLIFDDETQAKFEVKETNVDGKYTFELTAEDFSGLTPAQQAAELIFLQKVSLFNIPKKQKTMRSPVTNGALRRRSLPIGRGNGARVDKSN